MGNIDQEGIPRFGEMVLKHIDKKEKENDTEFKVKKEALMSMISKCSKFDDIQFEEGKEMVSKVNIDRIIDNLKQ